MKILLLSRYTDAGASSRYRSFQYLPYLRAHDFDITVAPLFSDLYIQKLYSHQRVSRVDLVGSFAGRASSLMRARRYDLVWLEYEAIPWVPYWFEALLSSSVPYIVDYDDAVFHRYDLHSSSIVRWMLGAKIDSVMRNSSAVVAGNEYLADRARKAGAKRVEILPTVIDIDRYPIRPMPNNEVFTIGWIGSLSTARYLSDIQPALKEVCKDNTARLIPIGIKSLDLEGVPFDLMQPWSEEREIEESYKFDVGIMPLPDTPWERGKCGLKLIKYMAAGRPVIASPVGVNREIVDHNINGFIASTLDEWSERLNSLRGDRSMRERMGREGRRKVEAKYCTKVAAPFLADIFRSIV